MDGVNAGVWRRPQVDWPYLFVDVEVGQTSYVTLRLHVANYPTDAPAGLLWDSRTASPLPVQFWPRGGNAERVWRPDWSVGNQGAPYMACDRTALATHVNWAAEHPERAWNPSRTIDFYLREIHRDLTNAHVPDGFES